MNDEAKTRAAAVEQAWIERGWPPALLADLRRLGVTDTRLGRALFWNTTLERMQDEARWADLLLNGNIRFRQLTIADNDAFIDLWANSPEEIGEWDVTVERGPDAFAQFDLQERPVLNGLFDGGTLVACVSFSLRRTLVGGQRISVRFGQAMRVHKDHRRHGYGNWVRSLPWAIGIVRPTLVQYDYLRARNMTMESWNRKHMPKVESVPVRDDEVPGTPVTVLKYRAQPLPASPGVRLAAEDDLAACAALINRTHAGRDLFRPHTAASLLERLERWDSDMPAPPGTPPPPYCLADFYVLEEGSEIVACAGLWDRGRDLRERWRHRQTGEERVIAGTAALDLGFAAGREDAAAALLEHLIGVSHGLGRDHLLAALETLPEVAALLAGREGEPETRYLQWRADTPPLAAPPHVDPVYW